MNRKVQRSILALISILCLLSPFSGAVPPALASAGEPGSAEFGVGARLDLHGSGFQPALNILKNLHLDWISIEYSWADFHPQPYSVADYSTLDQAVEAAYENGTAVMLSLTHPPAWAITPSGPSPEAVSNLLTEILTRYPSRLNAVELFPSPNTRNGWGANPDPTSYLRMFQTANAILISSSSLFLIVGGVDILTSPQSPGDLSAEVFLQKLFDLAKDTPPAVVGLRYPHVEGAPSAPDDGKYSIVLRHYEEIRQMIRAGGHPNTMFWITYLGLPPLPDHAAQSSWLAEAYPQVRSQLYIGAAFLQGINTCTPADNCAEVSLLEKDGSSHPFSGPLGNLILDNATFVQDIPGHVKSNVLGKSR